METKGLPVELQELQELEEHHGHICFGVLIGYKACKYAVDIIGQSDNMRVVTQNESCGNDAVRFLLGCTEEKGNLTCRKGNRQSWSFYNPDEEEGVTLTLSSGLKSQMPKDKDQALSFLLEMPGNILFVVEPYDGL